MVKKIIFLTFTRPDYSLNSVLIKGLRENGVEVLVSYIKGRGIFDFIRILSIYRRNSKNTDVIIIGYDSPGLVIFLRPFSRKKIIYNAFDSIYERFIISRELVHKHSPKAFYYWLLDFIAVHFANLILVESNLQADYFKKIFKISRSKIYKSLIRIDENKFYYNPEIKKRDKFTVVFRGRLLPEAGAEFAVMVAKKLENNDIDFIILADGQELTTIKTLILDLKPKNLELITDYLNEEELRNIMQSSHLSLGQLDNHERLNRTIPFKVFESLAMKLPYLTASNKGILELLKDGKSCITCNPADADSLADKILWVKNNYSVAEKIAENGYQFYKEELRPKTLVKKLIDRIADIN